MSYAVNPMPLILTKDIDLATAGEVLSMQIPSGMRGRIRYIHAAAYETFNAVTTPAYIRVGTAADPDAYAELSLATTADTDSIIMVASEMTEPDIASEGEQVEVTLVANTGGTPAGMACITVCIDCF